MEEWADNLQSCTRVREKLVRLYRFSLRKDLGGSFGSTPRFCRCENRGGQRRAVCAPDRQAGLSRCTERASPLSPVLCPAQCTLRCPRPVYSLVGEGSLVPSRGRQAALSELGQIGDPGSLGLGNTV